MIHLLLLLICVLSIEVLVRLNFFSSLETIIQVTKKVTHILPQGNISDHWKERVIPKYSLKVMRSSFQILLILLLIFLLFFISGFFVDDFLSFSFSLVGVVESLVFGFGYVCFRKYLIK